MNLETRACRNCHGTDADCLVCGGTGRIVLIGGAERWTWQDIVATLVIGASLVAFWYWPVRMLWKWWHG